MDKRLPRRSIGMQHVVVSGDTIKILWYDGDGLCLLAKRLERGRFVWPQVKEGTVSLTRAQLSMLLEGIDWRRVERTFQPLLAV
jgi:transposase